MSWGSSVPAVDASSSADTSMQAPGATHPQKVAWLHSDARRDDGAVCFSYIAMQILNNTHHCKCVVEGILHDSPGERNPDENAHLPIFHDAVPLQSPTAWIDDDSLASFAEYILKTKMLVVAQSTSRQIGFVTPWTKSLSQTCPRACGNFMMNSTRCILTMRCSRPFEYMFCFVMHCRHRVYHVL